jgi:acetylxylan esterase
MYPGYTGARPRFQVYHGSIDTTLRPQNYQETVKEWTGVFGYDATKPAKSQNNFPLNGYKTDTWGVSTANPLGTVQGIYAQNVGHTVPIQGYVVFFFLLWIMVLCGFWLTCFFNSAEDMKWFGLA